MSRIIIVVNRLPIKVTEKDNTFAIEKSSGGVATGLGSLSSSIEKLWVGWTGYYPKDNKQETLLSQKLLKKKINPVFLGPEDVENFYEGYCNATIWPLFHYFTTYTDHRTVFWEAYKRVNELFAKKVIEIAKKDDTIWIHDYHLMLLPSLLRKELPDAKIGFFLHIPFPSFELFRNLNNRKELIDGLLGANLIGFHIYDYMRHFMDTVYRIRGYEANNNVFFVENRFVEVDAFPMGINFTKFFNSPKINKTSAKITELKEMFKEQKIILSVDRLDYSKGILNRLEAFEHFLSENPDYIGKVIIYLLMVPSRDTVDRYQSLKVKIDEIIGKINGKFSKLNWIPIHYFYQTHSFEDLAALYNVADIALVTPLRDGMNLVAKEFIAAKAHSNGVLILSEMAGSAIELSESIMVNPNNIHDISLAIKNALEMNDKEKSSRIKNMQKYVKSQHVGKWARDFIKELNLITNKQIDFNNKLINESNSDFILKEFKKANNRIFFLDYDGTLTPYFKNPDKVAPNKNTFRIIKTLASEKNTDIVIISGRNREYLDNIFGKLNVMLVAEHGAYIKLNGKWEKSFTPDITWKEDIVSIMKEATEKTPGAFIEIKETAIVWHYRNVSRWLAELRIYQLLNDLIFPCTKKHLTLTKGEKIIEVTHGESSKGRAVINIMKNKLYDFVLAAGDDVTDIEMMQALPEQAITIKIGKPTEYSRFHVQNQEEFSNFLNVFNPKKYINPNKAKLKKKEKIDKKIKNPLVTQNE